MRPAILQKGFRPFFLIAALFAAVWIPFWAFRFSQGWSLGPWSGASWHAHEMIYGFLAAVITGFLLTAVENWTQERTVGPLQLVALVALWAAGRLSMISGATGLFAVGIDIAFFPALAFYVGRPILRTKNRRNYVVLAVLGGFFALNLGVHIGIAVDAQLLARRMLLAAVFLATALVLLIGGRIIPFFTRNAAHIETSSIAWVEKAIMVGAGALVASQFWPATAATNTLMVGVGLATLVRMKNWRTAAAMRIPMLAILHVAHIWLGLGMILRGVSAFVPEVSANLGLHIITLGGLSTMSLGMMTRVAMGHTGRTIHADVWTKLGFVLLTLAAVLRGIAPHLLPRQYLPLVIASSVAWASAFAAYVAAYFVILIAPRPDSVPAQGKVISIIPKPE